MRTGLKAALSSMQIKHQVVLPVLILSSVSVVCSFLLLPDKIATRPERYHTAQFLVHILCIQFPFGRDRSRVFVHVRVYTNVRAIRTKPTQVG